MLGGSRVDRVNELVRQELSELILRHVDIPDGVLATITRVECSPDLEHAKVWVSVLPTDQATATIDQLTHSAGELHRLLVRKLQMEPVPRINFQIDTSEVKAARIEDILDSLDDSA